MIDKKRTKRNYFKNTLTMLAVMVMATMLTACGSSKTEVSSTETETTKVETAKAEETEEVITEEEVTIESTTEQTPEPVVYEGIDMESTLPGAEWMETFDGVIEEPKMVIFNDETNKKVILENGQEAEISATDTFAIFYPKDKKIVRDFFMDGSLFCKNSNTMNIYFYYDLFPRYKDGDKVDVSQKIEVDGEEVELNATLVIKNN